MLQRLNRIEGHVNQDAFSERKNMMIRRKPHSTWRHRLCAYLILAACVLLATPSEADGPAPTQRQARYEVRFLTGMIDHHHMAVMMSEMCLNRDLHPELLALCQQIHETQMMEIEEMQVWLLDWYGIEYEPQMTPGMMHQMERMASLSDTEFEIEFMKRMIRHHWLAVIEARHCQESAFHPELIALCESIEATQTVEITLMQEWLCTWYGICNYGPQPH